MPNVASPTPRSPDRASRGRTWRRAAALALALLVAGCEVRKDELGPGIGPEGVVTDDDLVEMTDQKLRRFLGCADSIRTPIEESFTRYDDDVDDEGRPERRTAGVHIYPVPEMMFRQCGEVLADAPDTLPAMPEIERAAEALVDAGKTYADISRTLGEYLEAEGQLGDDWATVEELHPSLVAAYDAWARRDLILEIMLDGEKTANDPKLLELLSGQGRRLEFVTRSFEVSARPYVACVRKDPDKRGSDCGELHERFETAFDDFARHYDQKREESDRVFWMRSFAEDARSLHRVAADVQARLDAGREPTDEQLEALVDVHRILVRDAETLDFDFP